MSVGAPQRRSALELDVRLFTTTARLAKTASISFPGKAAEFGFIPIFSRRKAPLFAIPAIADFILLRKPTCLLA